MTRPYHVWIYPSADEANFQNPRRLQLMTLFMPLIRHGQVKAYHLEPTHYVHLPKRPVIFQNMHSSHTVCILHQTKERESAEARSRSYRFRSTTCEPVSTPVIGLIPPWKIHCLSGGIFVLQRTTDFHYPVSEIASRGLPLSPNSI